MSLACHTIRAPETGLPPTMPLRRRKRIHRSRVLSLGLPGYGEQLPLAALIKAVAPSGRVIAIDSDGRLSRLFEQHGLTYHRMNVTTKNPFLGLMNEVAHFEGVCHQLNSLLIGKTAITSVENCWLYQALSAAFRSPCPFPSADRIIIDVSGLSVRPVLFKSTVTALLLLLDSCRQYTLRDQLLCLIDPIWPVIAKSPAEANALAARHQMRGKLASQGRSVIQTLWRHAPLRGLLTTHADFFSAHATQLLQQSAWSSPTVGTVLASDALMSWITPHYWGPCATYQPSMLINEVGHDIN